MTYNPEVKIRIKKNHNRGKKQRNEPAQYIGLQTVFDKFIPRIQRYNGFVKIKKSQCLCLGVHEHVIVFLKTLQKADAICVYCAFEE